MKSEESAVNACRAALAIREEFSRAQSDPHHPLKDFETSIGGSGSVVVRGGRADRFEASIAGSGDVDFRAPAATAEINMMGGGDVRIASVSGTVERNVMGGGRITIGNQ